MTRAIRPLDGSAIRTQHPSSIRNSRPSLVPAIWLISPIRACSENWKPPDLPRLGTENGPTFFNEDDMTENSSSSSSSGGIGFCGLLTILFIGLKLTNFIDWSWWWVLSPLWIGFAVF